GKNGTHPYWGSKIFDYGKNEVRRFLLSNIRYWMEEFCFDGFRFDGVTSMLYFHRGYIDYFGTYENYFGEDVDNNAIIYLSLANDLIHESKGISIAEEVSGMPGITVPTQDGGIGFDYRLSMGLPDFWIKIIKERSDENWVMSELWRVFNDRLPNVPQIAYCESHDQALVGDQTLAFRLMGANMYSSMGIDNKDSVIERGLALHKMIRLFTLAVGSNGGGYLNFMGNEFGHPEWIDFPREGNNWSYKYARRQWSLADTEYLRYKFLQEFDKAIIALAKEYNPRVQGYPELLHLSESDKTIAFSITGKYKESLKTQRLRRTSAETKVAVEREQRPNEFGFCRAGATSLRSNNERTEVRDRVSSEVQRKDLSSLEVPYIFVFNWHPSSSIPNYKIPAPEAGKYEIVLNSDNSIFGGFERITGKNEYFTAPSNNNGNPILRFYNINRSVLVFKKVD
ncbi:MAG: alpha amylase C-terminal domain-containing protein, partial [Bacteroidales bacterium]|nr:alpha amylase C-terminal domain-containing protein [Bacteroidales bacterium]